MVAAILVLVKLLGVVVILPVGVHPSQASVWAVLITVARPYGRRLLASGIDSRRHRVELRQVVVTLLATPTRTSTGRRLPLRQPPRLPLRPTRLLLLPNLGVERLVVLPLPSSPRVHRVRRNH